MNSLFEHITAVGRKFIYLVVTCVSFLCVSVDLAAAKVIYVDAINQGGTGSKRSPLSTIREAVDIALPGDVVLVRHGTYPEQVMVARGGTLTKPITVRGEPGAVIDASGLPRGSSAVEILGDHIVFEGFRVRNSPRTGIALWGASHVIVRRNMVHGSQGAGIWVGHHDLGRSANNIIEANTVFDNARMNVARKRSWGWPQGISIAVSDRTKVRKNLVYGNFGEGIGVLSSVGATVEENIVYDNFSVNIYLDNAPQSLVRFNRIGSTGDRKFFRKNRPPAGVLIANEETTHPLPSSRITVVKNIMSGVEGVHYGKYGLNTGLSNSILSPNTITPGKWFLAPATVRTFEQG